MKLDLSKFKKVAHNKTHTIMEHPEGHLIHVAHKSVKKEDMEKLKALPMSEGGKVESTSDKIKKKMSSADKASEGFNSALGMKGLKQAVTRLPHFADGSEEPIKEDERALQLLASPENQPLQEAPSTPAPLPTELQAMEKADEENAIKDLAEKPSSDPYLEAAKQQEQSIRHGVEAQQVGLEREAQAQAILASQQAKAQKAFLDKSQRAEEAHQEYLSDMGSKIQTVQKAINEQNIDPNRLWNNKGTGEKIATIIGMFAAGLSGVKVMDVMKQLQDQDLEAQKADLGKKETLLSSYLKQYGDQNVAYQMTKATQLQQMATQLERIANLNKNPILQAQQLQQVGKFQMDSAAALSQAAQMRAALGETGPGNQGNASRLIDIKVPEKERTEAHKELKEAGQVLKFRDNLLNAFDQVDGMVLGGAFSPNQRDAIVEPLIAQLSKESAGRFTEADAHAIRALFPSAKDNPFSHTTRDIKRQQLAKFLDQKMTFPLLENYNIPMPKDSSSKQESAPVRGADGKLYKKSADGRFMIPVNE